MIVKICGITRREDAVAAAEAGASALGFIFYPKSPRYVMPEKARELGEGLELWKVGVFVDEDPAAVWTTVVNAGLDVAQIYGRSVIPEGSVRFWHAIRLQAEAQFGFRYTGNAEAIFLDGAANGVTFDWRIVRLMKTNSKLIIAGGLNPSNVAEAIHIARPWGVDASSGLEISPGIKDHQKVRQFIKAAREASQ